MFEGSFERNKQILMNLLQSLKKHDLEDDELYKYKHYIYGYLYTLII